MVPNIGSRGQARRLRLGFVALGVAVVFAMATLMLGAPPAWRAAVFVPLWISALGVLQARDRT